MLLQRSVVCVLLGLTVAIAGACDGSDGDEDSTPPAPADDDWGPLAVVEEESLSNQTAGGGSGTLRIGDDCVTLDSGESRTTLIWRDSQVRWEDGRILFQDGADVVTLEDGDSIRIGGGEAPDPQAYESRWLSRPDETCPSRQFAVHSVEFESSPMG